MRGQVDIWDGGVLQLVTRVGGGFRQSLQTRPYGGVRVSVGAGLEGWRRAKIKTVDICHGFRSIMATRPPPMTTLPPCPPEDIGERAGRYLGWWSLAVGDEGGWGIPAILADPPLRGREGFGRGGSGGMAEGQNQNGRYLPRFPVNNGDPPSPMTTLPPCPPEDIGERAGRYLGWWSLVVGDEGGWGIPAILADPPLRGREGFGRGGSGGMAEGQNQNGRYLPRFPVNNGDPPSPHDHPPSMSSRGHW